MIRRTGRDMTVMPISEAVQLPGGNGLASPAFQAPLNFFGIYGWQHVEQGVEALICDGEVVTKTRFASDWFSAIGRRRYLRRVLLQPAPLKDITVKALSRDQLSVTLTISVTYSVADPVHVASLQDPIGELTGALVGCAAELARAMSYEQIVADTGGMRQELKHRLGQEASVTSWFNIVQVLSITPVGDERLLEVGRQKRIVEGERGLVTAKGENELIATDYDVQIKAQQARLEEMRADREHQREMERRSAEYTAQGQQAFLKALGDVAAAGIDPSKLAEVIRDAPQLGGGVRPSGADTRVLTDSSGSAAESGPGNPRERERAALASLQDAGTIESFEMLGSKGDLEGAIARVGSYDVIMTCGPDHPRAAPELVVRFRDGSSFSPSFLWIPGVSESLAQALSAVIPQADQEVKQRGSQAGGFGFDWDEDSEGDD